MTSKDAIVTNGTKPDGYIDIADAIDDVDNFDYEALAASIETNDKARQAVKDWRNDNTVVYQAGNGNRLHVTVFSHSQPDIVTMDASMENHFEHVFTVTMSIPQSDDVRVKTIGHIAYNGGMVSQLTASGKLATIQELGTLETLNKMVRKAQSVSDVFNDYYFKRHESIVARATVSPAHEPIQTEDGPLLHKG